MKLISVDTARTAWFFPLSELNPAGRSLTNVFLGLTERYGFTKFPKHTLDIGQDDALTFEGGNFTTTNGVRILVKLRIYNDGCIADSWSSTTDSEDFLKDATFWLKEKHGLALPTDRSIRTTYLSQLTVTTNRKLVTLNPKLHTFVDALSTAAGKFAGDEIGFNVAGISLWSNDPKRPFAPSPFRFENKATTLPDEKRFFSQAPLPTDAHLTLLDKLEAILR